MCWEREKDIQKEILTDSEQCVRDRVGERYIRIHRRREREKERKRDRRREIEIERERDRDR